MLNFAFKKQKISYIKIVNYKPKKTHGILNVKDSSEKNISTWGRIL